MTIHPLRQSVVRPLVHVSSLAFIMAIPAPLLAQGHGGHENEFMATAGSLQVVYEPDHRDIVMLLGPLDLPATGSTMRLTPAGAVTVPVDGWLTGFRARVVDDHGNELPREILHHMNLVRPHRRELFMPVMQRLAAAGQETDEIRVPFPFGIPVSKGDTILVVAMVHNPTARSVRAFVEGRLHYDTPRWLDRLDVEPFYLDIKPPPEEASFDLPPGQSTFTWEGSPAIDVKVLGLGGHLHQHAVELRLEEVRPDDDAKVLWRARPDFRTDGLVEEIPRKTFLLRLGLGLSSDRVYRIVATYDNPTGDTIPAGGMAELAGVAWPGGEWPAPDPAHPDFLADYRSFTRNSPVLQDRFGPAVTRP